MTTDQTARIAETLAKLAGQITKAREFQVIRRNRDDGDIEYQIFADTDVPKDGCQIAWVQSTKADAEFIAFAFTHADLLTTLQAALEESNAERDRWLSCAEAADDALETLRRERDGARAANQCYLDFKARAEAAEAALSTLQTQVAHLPLVCEKAQAANPTRTSPCDAICMRQRILALLAALLPAPEGVSEPAEMVHPIQTKLTILLRAEAAEAALSTLQTQARELLDKLVVMANPINTCVMMSTIHGVPYSGPSWSTEFDALKAALLPAPEGETSG